MRAFRDRHHAGRVLANILSDYRNSPNTSVLALVRGGVPVAYEVAAELDLPLDVFLVRKVGVPENPELAMGAVASGDVGVLNDEVVETLQLSEEVIEQETESEQEELRQKEKFYRDDRSALEIEDRIVILVDDGLATGTSMRAAIAALNQRHPRKIVVAVPVAPPSVCEELEKEADKVVCAITPEYLRGIGHWYDDFSQVDDEHVLELLEKVTPEGVENN